LLALWLAGVPLGLALVALTGSGFALALLARRVGPLGVLASGLRACLSAEETPESVRLSAQADARGAGGMVGEVAELGARLAGMRQRLTNRHPVTGLPTREPFLAGLIEDVGGGARPVVLAVVRFADYDRLAAFDQGAADGALKAFSERLRRSIPGARPLAQVDRDCFAVWFRDGGGQDAVAGELQALAYVLAQELGPDLGGELSLSPTIAIGASVFPEDGAGPAELLTRAFAALEAGQQQGRALTFFSTQGSAAARERFSLEQDLRGAVARDELRLHYQPVVDVESGRVVGAEALLRWRHPSLGLLAPDRFIPILERSPMMGEVGLWVLNAACREARSWREHGLGDLKAAVNLSTVQCRDPRLSDMVLRTLQRHGLPPSSLELELTETAAMEDAEHIRRLLGELRAHGVSVAIDDFGTGYSSLSYLKNLPFSKLKIDREFVSGVDRRRDSRAICAALIALSRGLGIAVLAEGVETRAEMETLREMGCRLFQGFFFAQPMDGPSFAAALKNPSWLGPLLEPRADDAPTPRRAAR
jgi:EAL domain-containing protein (putative c-di-GMP-specific phosphodiesterase class I)/GGDEF domain-containing protein